MAGADEGRAPASSRVVSRYSWQGQPTTPRHGSGTAWRRLGATLAERFGWAEGAGLMRSVGSVNQLQEQRRMPSPAMHKRCNANANMHLFFSVLFVADNYFCFRRIAILNGSAARDVL